MIRVLDPFVADNWIRAVLLDTSGATCEVNGETVSADAVAIVQDRIYPARDDFEPPAWPYIVYSGAPGYENHAQDLVLADGDYTIRQVMRQDKIEDGSDVEDYNRPGFIAICAAFQDVQFVHAEGGVIHGCRVLRPYIRLYGESERKVSEMGVVARIVST